MKLILFIGMLLPCLPAGAETLEGRLERFHSDTKSFYNERVPKFDAENEDVERPSSFLREADPTLSRVVDVKLRHRREIGKGTVVHGAPIFYVEPKPNDRVESLLEIARPVKNIFRAEELGLREAELSEHPWSGDYWPLYRGVLGMRFMDLRFPYAEDWGRLYKYITQFPFFEIFETGDASKIKTLATSEKYDLLAGDMMGTLTQNMWGQGKEYYDAHGKVETWMGICHGWAAAAVMVSRPQNEISVVAHDGKTQLTFNPSEIKGLISYLWANTPYRTRFIGGRCNLKTVERDEMGRPLAPECFDTNPATWHTAVINQIGVAKRGFVMDVTADYEVWNQPVYAYKIKYFNPETRQETLRLDDALVKREHYQSDKFKKYRSPKATQFVGVEMEVQYIVEESANDRIEDEPLYDGTFKVRYLYDLELDFDGGIVGGEWYQNQHPDFLWVPEQNAKPRTYEDVNLRLSDWKLSEPLPEDWKTSAQWASKSGRVLSSIVDVMIEASKNKTPQ